MKVGILGAGQLGRMLALAGYPLGMQFRFLDPNPESPAGDVAKLISADYQDSLAVEQFARDLQCVTYEFENVPVEVVEKLEGQLPTYPPSKALRTAQDRLLEKSFFAERGIPVPKFAPINLAGDLDAAMRQFGTPAVLKTRRFGYDGKGQFVLKTKADVTAAWESLGGGELILESFVKFERELSIIGVRDKSGNCVFYPLCQNEHRGGILYKTVSPAPDIDARLQKTAEDYARLALEELQYVGVLAIELFQCGRELLVNEMAPRVHNSGHWSIEGAQTSQFENHLRAVAGLPLGSTRPRGQSVIFNLIGTAPQADKILDVPGAHLHLYNKAPRPERKIGHVTLLGENLESLRDSCEAVERLIGAAKEPAQDQG